MKKKGQKRKGKETGRRVDRENDTQTLIHRCIDTPKWHRYTDPYIEQGNTQTPIHRSGFRNMHRQKHRNPRTHTHFNSYEGNTDDLKNSKSRFLKVLVNLDVLSELKAR